MGHIHVCSVWVVPCDDPEDQLILANGSEGLLFYRGHGRVEWILWCVWRTEWSLSSSYNWPNWRVIRLEDWGDEVFLTLIVLHKLLCSFTLAISSQIIFHCPFFVWRCLPQQTSGCSPEWQGSPPTFWLSRRDSTSSNTGTGVGFFLNYLLGIFLRQSFLVGYIPLFTLVFWTLQSIPLWYS